MVLVLFGGIIWLGIFVLLALEVPWVWVVSVLPGLVAGGLLVGALCDAAGRADETGHV